MSATLEHPAKFSPAILEAIEDELEREQRMQGRPIRVLDPFAGVGGIHTVRREPDILTLGVELEPEWAAASEHTIVGDATALPSAFTSLFDVVATSPAYGNRMADQYDGRDGSRRHTYRIALRRPLSAGSGAGLQWGDAYRELHAKAWTEVDRVLRPGGLVILNVKDHVRGGTVQGVTSWHVGNFAALGYGLEWAEEIDTPGMRHGANAEARCPEMLIALRKPA